MNRGRHARPRRRGALVAIAALAAAAAVAVAGAGEFVRTPPERDGHPARWEFPNLVRPTGISSQTPATDPSGATDAPPMGWTWIAGIQLPTSPDLGPTNTQGGLARGFARTEHGAVLAAAHILARATPQTGPRIFQPTITGQIFDPKGDALLRAVTEQYHQARTRQGVPIGEPLQTSRAITITGYHITDTNPREPAGITKLTGAKLQLLLHIRGGRHRAMALEVRWLGGDWRLYAPTHNRWSNHITITPHTDHYSRFPPSDR